MRGYNLLTPLFTFFMPPYDDEETRQQDHQNGATFINRLLDDKVREGEKKAYKNSKYYTDSRVNAVAKSLAAWTKLSVDNQLEIKRQLESLSRRISNGIDLPKLFKRFVIASKIEMLAIILIAFAIYYYFDHVVRTIN